MNCFITDNFCRCGRSGGLKKAAIRTKAIVPIAVKLLDEILEARKKKGSGQYKE